MKIYTNEDANPSALHGGSVAIIGYGSQGRAHALNLRDSGQQVIVGARPGGSAAEKAAADGFEVFTPAEAAGKAALVALLTPDMSHKAVYEDDIAPNLAAGGALLVAHGFSIHFGQITPRTDIDVILVAPKGPGDLVRREFERGAGVPSLFAIYQDSTGKAKEKALAYTASNGGTTAGAIETTFAEETETDLFGEQAVLCGGATELVLTGFETLVEAGYKPEVAYFECLHELKLIVDLLYEGGLAKMHNFISETAKYGDLIAGPRVVNAETKARMKEVLTDIQQGDFAKDWMLENLAGKPKYSALLEKDLNHPIESIGKDLRARMSWLQANAETAEKQTPEKQAAE